ncbi:methyltransferase, partial [Emiliania huxleyi CCMP1516]|uniref:Methyltransferase type 11 domain-containing protein n=2 Tax=Emiliania huxleyi TaxID=2903 RepID=A0A0D3IEN7_EMIH1
MSRPERTAAAQAFYDPAEAAKYSASARMGRTQRHLAERALHLLDIRQPGALLLDLGCGTGYSGAPLERAGHAWVGLDLSESMLRAARAPGKRRDVLCADLGAPLWLRRRVFDGAVSISAVQWLCHATANGHDPAKRVRTFFRGLKAVLVPGARAVLQLYPEQPEHMDWRHGRTLLASRPRHARRRLPALRAVKEALPCADVAEPGGGGGGREEARSGVASGGGRRWRREAERREARSACENFEEICCVELGGGGWVRL